jgi:tetratricopeptide (TPR) repeat protein
VFPLSPFIAVLLVTASPPIGAQAAKPEPQATISDEARFERWTIRYNKAIHAINKEDYEVAIPLLKTAIAIDPVDEPNRRIAKGATEDYFPHYYLFIAYLKTGQIAKAREYYNLRGPLTPKLAAEAQTYLDDLLKAEQKK